MLKHEVHVLEPFVGVWNTEGKFREAQGEDGELLIATDIYEWLPGKRFLLHRVDARFGNNPTRSIEIIGYDKEKEGIFSNSYDDNGVTTNFKCSFTGNDWSIYGDGIRFRGAFNKNWQKLAGTWEMKADGVWSPWMDIQLIKAY